MSINFQPPSKEVEAKVKPFLLSLKGKNFIHTLESIYAQDKIFLPLSIQNKVINIGSGTSEYPAFDLYRQWIADDILLRSYYYNYSSPAGSQTIREALSVMENVKLRNPQYTPEMICLTEGATGAISSLFEYFKNYYPNSEVLIQTPEYYVFAFSAKYYSLNYKEVKVDFSSKHVNTINTLISSVTPKTKIIILTNPDNPLGVCYKSDDIRKLIKYAKSRNIYLIIDEVFFDLLFDKKSSTEADRVAEEEMALDNLIIVKSYAKNKNLPGLRIGYVLSTNLEIIEHIETIQEQRVFFATGSNYKTFLIFDAFMHTLDYSMSLKESSVTIVQKIRKLFPHYEPLKKISNRTILRYYDKYCLYRNDLITAYSNNFDKAMQLFKPYIDNTLPKDSAFNTLIHIPALDKVNYFDFCLNLYLCTGLKISMGPYFGLTQKDWQDDLGFWMRITFGLSKENLEKGIGKFIEFMDYYQKNENQMIKTQLII